MKELDFMLICCEKTSMRLDDTKEDAMGKYFLLYCQECGRHIICCISISKQETEVVDFKKFTENMEKYR